MNKNIVLCGVGGQGIVLAAKLLAAAAMENGLNVMSAETIGMAQRGGSVFSFVKIGDAVDTPMMGNGTADLIIGFEPGEAVRVLPYLKAGGTVITSDRPVIPVSASLHPESYQASSMITYLQKTVPDLHVINTRQAVEELQSDKVLNVLMLGAVAETGVLGFDPEEMLRVVRERVPARFVELNTKAFMTGRRMV